MVNRVRRTMIYHFVPIDLHLPYCLHPNREGRTKVRINALDAFAFICHQWPGARNSFNGVKQCDEWWQWRRRHYPITICEQKKPSGSHLATVEWVGVKIWNNLGGVMFDTRLDIYLFPSRCFVYACLNSDAWFMGSPNYWIHKQPSYLSWPICINQNDRTIMVSCASSRRRVRDRNAAKCDFK